MKKLLFVLILLSIFTFTNITSGYFNIIDKPNQIVDHLFNIKNVPAAKSIAISPNGKELWTTLLMNNKRGLSIFNMENGEKITDINLNNGGGVEIIFTKNGEKAYVSQMETAKVFEIDTNTKKILRVFSTKSSWTKVLALSLDEKTLYASNWLGNNVSVFDLINGKLIKNIKTVKTPRGIYPTDDGKFLYVAGYDKGEIQKINLVTNEKKVIFKNGGAMRHMAVDSENKILYISDMLHNIILKLSLIDDSVSTFVKTDQKPNTIALSPDNKILFVSCRGKNNPKSYYLTGPEWGSVLLFDTATGKKLDAIVGGNQPTALGLSTDGSILAFSDFLDAKIEIFKIPSYEILIAGNGGRSLTYKRELLKK